MLKYITLVFLLITTFQVCASDEDSKWNLNPTLSEISEDKVFIPEDLESAFKELSSMLSPILIDEMKNNSEEDMIQYHRGLGMWLRNNWGLWGSSKLSNYFKNIGINHPDDMSGIILDSYWRKLNDVPINLDQQVKYYQDYWSEVEVNSE